MDVEGNATCPSASEVSERLQPLLAPLAMPESKERVRLTQQGANLKVQLFANDIVVATRDLPPRNTCRDLAEVAAVVVAAWAIDLHSTLAPTPVPQPAPEPPHEVAPRGTPQSRWGLGVGLLAAPAATSALASISATTWIWRPWAGLHLRLWGQWPHERALGPGDVDWWRVGALLAPSLTFTAGRGVLEVFAGLGASRISAQGHGYPSVAKAAGFEGGAAAGLRAGFGWGRMLLFADVLLVGWFDPQRLVITPAGTMDRLVTVLPRLEPHMAIGASWACCR